MSGAEYELVVTYTRHDLEAPLLERLLALRPRGMYGVTGVAAHELHAFFDTPLSLARVRRLLAGMADSLRLDLRRVEPRDWDRDWLRVWQPVRIGRFLVRPPGLRTRARRTWVIEIEPGQAFGTGLHETTQLMLRLLSSLDVTQWDVLDMGTGTGVLAIAAARAGARRVLALDRDPTAVAEARANVVRNRVPDRVIVVQGDVATLPAGAFDLVLANLDMTTLIRSGPRLRSVLRAGGIWLASGVTVDQARRFETWLRRQFRAPFRRRRQGIWLAYRISV